MPEDRDQLFEQALARHLREEGDGAALCLDPETLAAYYECTLSPEEVSSAKSHIVSCARCQEILAHLETTQEVNESRDLAEHSPELIAGLNASQVASVRDRTFPLRASVATERASTKKIIAIPPKKYFSLRWAAPAGAIAAGLLIWIGVRESRLAIKPSAPAAQVAGARQQPLPSSDAEERKESDSASGLKTKKSDQAASAGRAPAAPEVALRDEQKDFAVDQKLEAREKPAGPPARLPRLSRSGPSAAAGQAQATDSIQRGDRVLVDGAAQTVEVVPAPADLERAQVQPAPAAKSAITGASAPPPAPPPPSAGAAGVQVAGALAENEVITRAEVSKQAMYNKAVSKVGLDIRIAAPGGKKIWSVGPNGQILHSKDSGRTWLPQFSGVAVNLSAGAAPSDQVCWLVGAAGTVLRTTDGGEHWQTLRTPISGDLGGLHASDAKHASIWDAPHRQSYETSDGGATWKQTANE